MKKEGFIIKANKNVLFVKRGCKTKQKNLPGMPRLGAHRLHTPQPFSNHVCFIYIYIYILLYKSTYFNEFMLHILFLQYFAPILAEHDGCISHAGAAFGLYIALSSSAQAVAIN